MMTVLAKMAVEMLDEDLKPVAAWCSGPPDSITVALLMQQLRELKEIRFCVERLRESNS